MIIALLLLAYAAFLAFPAAGALRRAGWTERAPRLGIITWQALSVSIIGSALLAGLTATVRATQIGGISRQCHAAVRWSCPPDITPGGAALAAIGGATTLALAVRIVWCLATAYAAAGRLRHRQLDALTVLGRADTRLGATLIEHATPAAYCLPGRHGRIVVTTAALAALDDAQLTAVLAHERGHLRQRHHLVLAAAQAFARAFPPLPVFRVARDQIARLTELAADDSATRRADRLTIAEALLTLAQAAPAAGPANVPALAAGGTGSAARARRLIAAPRPLGRVRMLLGLAAAGAILTAPLLAASAPALTASDPSCCQATSTAPHIADVRAFSR
jgi:Zn-dependent protease with chaperone function